MSKIFKPFINLFLTSVHLYFDALHGLQSLHNKQSFPLRISSANVIKSAVTADLFTFTEEIVN